MAGFSELIKNFDKTRDYVRDFFICGFKVRNDFDRKSARSYDDEKRRVESWLGDNLRYDRTVRGRNMSISVDSGHISTNPLYSAYYSKSFTDNDIRLHFLLTDILQSGEKLSLKALVNALTDEYGAVFEEQTVRNKLKEYAAEGLFICEKQGRTDLFSLSPLTAEGLLDEYMGLWDAVSFFSEDGCFGVVGNSILRAAGKRNDHFLMKHNYIVHTLEDAVLPEIITAIDEKREISFKSQSAKGESKDITAVGFMLLSSVQTGRRYLAAYVPEFERFTSFRLDRIYSPKAGSVRDDYDELKKSFYKALSRCFGVSFGNGEVVTPVKLTFTLDEESEPFILERLMREKRSGTLEKTGEGQYTLTVDALDPKEVIAWARTFIGRIVSAEGGDKQTLDTFQNDIRRLNEMYNGEVKDNEHIQ